MEVHAAPGLDGAQSDDGRQIPLCIVALVRRPDDILSCSSHFEVEQRGLARSHASAWRDWKTWPILECAQSACLAKNLGARKIATTGAVAKRERLRLMTELGRLSCTVACPRSGHCVARWPRRDQLLALHGCLAEIRCLIRTVACSRAGDCPARSPVRARRETDPHGCVAESRRLICTVACSSPEGD